MLSSVLFSLKRATHPPVHPDHRPTHPSTLEANSYTKIKGSRLFCHKTNEMFSHNQKMHLSWEFITMGILTYEDLQSFRCWFPNINMDQSYWMIFLKMHNQPRFVFCQGAETIAQGAIHCKPRKGRNLLAVLLLASIKVISRGRNRFHAQCEILFAVLYKGL